MKAERVESILDYAISLSTDHVFKRGNSQLDTPWRDGTGIRGGIVGGNVFSLQFSQCTWQYGTMGIFLPSPN